MTDEEKLAKIKNHERIRIQRINVTRRLGLTEKDCHDETTMRRFVYNLGKTLPDMIEIVVERASEDDKTYAWHISIFENPNEREKLSS